MLQPIKTPLRFKRLGAGHYRARIAHPSGPFGFIRYDLVRNASQNWEVRVNHERYHTTDSKHDAQRIAQEHADRLDEV